MDSTAIKSCDEHAKNKQPAAPELPVPHAQRCQAAISPPVHPCPTRIGCSRHKRVSTQCQIQSFINSHFLRFELTVVSQFYLDFVGTGYNMIIRKDISALDDETGTEAPLLVGMWLHVI